MIEFPATYRMEDGASHMPSDRCRITARGSRATELTKDTAKIIYVAVITIIIPLKVYSLFPVYSVVRKQVLDWIVWQIGNLLICS